MNRLGHQAAMICDLGLVSRKGDELFTAFERVKCLLFEDLGFQEEKIELH